MKRILLLISCIILYTLANCQIVKIVSDDGSLKDSIEFGYKENATIGLNPALEELDLTNLPFKKNELRILQRGKDDYSCLRVPKYDGRNKRYYYTPFYYEQSFDSKTNFRNSYTGNRYFEIFGNIESWVNINYYFSQDPESFIELQVTPPSDCTAEIRIAGGFSNLYYVDGKYNIQGVLQPGLNRITFVFKESEYITKSNDKIDTNINLYPNPGNDQVKVNLDDKFSYFEVYNALGIKIMASSSLQNIKTAIISTQNWDRGIYTFSFKSMNGNSVSKKWLKIL